MSSFDLPAEQMSALRRLSSQVRIPVMRLLQRGADVPSEPREADDAAAAELRRLHIYTPQRLKDVAARRQWERREVVEGLIRESSINVLVGDSNLGKTPLAVLIGVCIAAGLPVFGHRVQQGRVLYCDAESDLQSFCQMLDGIMQFLELPEPPRDFHVWSPNWGTDLRFSDVNSPWGHQLIERVSVVRPRLVVVDPLRMFWPQAETKNVEVAEIVTSLRNVSRTTGASWLISHHRRKTQLQGPVADLIENPHAWFQEAAGAHALINQSDTRLGVVPHPGEGDLLVGGFMRGVGPLPVLDLARAMDEEGTPIGYKVLTGVQHLNPDDREVFKRLGLRFRFKDVAKEMGGKSASNANRFLKKCISLQVVHKDGTEYEKADAAGGASGVNGVGDRSTDSTGSMGTTTEKG